MQLKNDKRNENEQFMNISSPSVFQWPALIIRILYNYSVYLVCFALT